MPCEDIKNQLEKLRSERDKAEAEYQALPGSAKTESPLRGEIVALGKQIAAANANLSTCLIKSGVVLRTVSTKFHPETDGFLFANHWTWDSTEKETLHKIISDALGGLEALLSPILYATFAPLFLAIPPPFDLIAIAAAVKAANGKIVDSITQAIEKSDNGVYGLCGGMTFAALDYWHKQWVVPQGNGPADQPQRTTPEGKVLRDYIWHRLIKSVLDNALTFLKWMGMVHTQDGEKWLVEQTSQHLAAIRETITGGRPVPIGLIGNTSNPFHNHQVLCYGFKDEQDGTMSLLIYDNNRPNTESIIRLDARGPKLKIIHDDTFQADRGPLCGLFYEAYTPAEPPKTVVLRERLSATPPSARVNQPVSFRYTAHNVGYRSAPLNLLVSTERGTLVGEASPEAIQMGGQRQLKWPITFRVAGDEKVAVAAEQWFSLQKGKGRHVVKLLPLENPNQTEMVTVKVTA
jgi:hypothetical protein